MSRSADQRQLLGALASVAKALGHEYRLELLELVAQRERSVEALTRLTGLPVGSVSQHLQQLRRCGLVAARKDGKHVLYSLADEQVLHLVSSLRSVAERNVAEVQQLVEQYFAEDQSLDVLSPEALLERLRSGEVTLIDVRPPEEYAAGHVPGALNLPLEELEQRLAELPGDQPVVAYCRGPYCALSIEAVERLRARGIAAGRLATGFPEWRARGHPIQ